MCFYISGYLYSIYCLQWPKTSLNRRKALLGIDFRRDSRLKLLKVTSLYTLVKTKMRARYRK